MKKEVKKYCPRCGSANGLFVQSNIGVYITEDGQVENCGAQTETNWDLIYCCCDYNIDMTTDDLITISEAKTLPEFDE